MKLAELRKMNTSELHELRTEQQEALVRLRFKIAMDEHTKVRDMRVLKRLIARINTVVRETELAANKATFDQSIQQ